MDLCDSEDEGRPLAPIEDKNGTAQRTRTRKVSSRYKSPGPLRTPVPKRSASPNIGRVSPLTSTLSIPKRAVSAGRRGPSTPAKDTLADMLMTSRKILGHKAAESLWPSTVGGLNVSFQSESCYVPGNKRERAFNDRTLRSSSNTAHKGEMFSARRPTVERRRNLFTDQPENAKPVENLSTRLVVDQRQWRSIASGISKSRNVTEQSGPSLRRLSLDGMSSKPLQKSARDLLMLMSGNGLVNDSSLRAHASAKSSDRIPSVNDVRKMQSLTSPRPSSPSVSRGASPNRAKPVNPSLRGHSPARMRPSSPMSQNHNTNSVLSFVVDIKKGTKTANLIEDVHQLRLFYNRHMQWRYANARSEALLCSQKTRAEKTLYSVWRKTVDLQESVIYKRLSVQALKLKLMLHSILNNQISCLDDWAAIEREHTSSLACAIQDLQACIVQIPLAGGARVDIGTLKETVSSAVDVMQTLESTLSSILPPVERTNSFSAEVARVAALERAMVDECESLLSSTAVLQVEENSLRAYLLQIKQDLTEWCE